MAKNTLKDVLNHECPICRRKMTKLVRLREDGMPLKNYTWICENPKCLMFVDYKKVRGWKYARLYK